MAQKKIFIMAPYPLSQAPSQRFRFEQYFEVLLKEGFSYQFKTFYTPATWKILHQEGNVLAKSLRIILSFLVRFAHVFKSLNADYIFIHRELTPIGPPFFEWILAKVFRKKIIYDFDDAIWLPNYSEANTKFQKLKYYSKVKKIIKWSWKISVGNEYLGEYAKRYNPNIIINPTTIDTENYHNPALFKTTKNTTPIIGWTGTHTTAKYLEFLTPILIRLTQTYNFKFIVISNENPLLKIPNFEFIKWTKENEIQDLMKFDLGVMPLSNDKWARGKCGFKSLQYMSLKIPSIASPVGVNTKIIDHQINGFLSTTEDEWYNALEFFLKQAENTDKMKEAARKKIIDHYSVLSNSENFIALFK